MCCVVIVVLRLKEVRKENKMSQEELAKLIGVTQATLSGWENEKYEIDNKSLILCADIFCVSIDYLLGRTVKPTLASIPSIPTLHLNPTNENTICITRRTGAQSSYTLSDKQTDIIEGMLEQMPRATDTDNTSVYKNPLDYGAVAAEGGKYNRRPTKKPKTT